MNNRDLLAAGLASGRVQIVGVGTPKPEPPAKTTGNLIRIGRLRLGDEFYDWSECVDCRVKFPHIGGGPSCNGVEIHLCPWCRPDSEPWKHGRGS